MEYGANMRSYKGCLLEIETDLSSVLAIWPQSRFLQRPVDVYVVVSLSCYNIDTIVTVVQINFLSSLLQYSKMGWLF